MYIINNKNQIFNTDCIPVITADGVHVLAVFGNVPRPISYNVECIKTIRDGLIEGREFVEVD